jgi:hypothetical protein
VAWSGERRIHVQYNIEVPTGPTERKISWLSEKTVSNVECFLGLPQTRWDLLQMRFVFKIAANLSCSYRSHLSTGIFVYTTQHVIDELFQISSLFVGVRIAVKCRRWHFI